jgi:hypothetical protein
VDGEQGMKSWISVLALGFTVMPASAHHSIAGVYDSSREVTIRGVISEFHFVNPHPFVIVDVKADNGTQQWKLEMDNLSELIDVGMTGQTFKRGDRVIVAGSLIRPPRIQGLYIRKLDRPSDGFQYEQVGSSPRIHLPPETKGR